MHKFLRLLLLFLFPMLLLLLVAATEHKFYVSTTIVEYKPAEQVLQVTTQLFIDDLELLLQKEAPEIRLAPDSDSTRIHRVLASNLKKHLVFKMEGSALPYHFLGKEYKNDIAVCYLEVPLQEGTALEVINNFLYELFEEQKNIIHFKNQGKRKSYLLHKESPSVRLLLQD